MASVEYGKIIRGNTQIFVKADDGEVSEYLVPHGKHMRVHSGDRCKPVTDSAKVRLIRTTC